MSVLSAVCLSMISTSLYGVGLSPDSVGYIRVARDIFAHGSLFLIENVSVSQPPAYPAMLAIAAKLFGTRPLVAANYVNTVVYAVLIISVLFSVWQLSRSIWAVVTIGMMLSFAHPLLYIHTMAFSEPLFTLLITATLLIAILRTPSWQSVILMGLLTGIACLTRYAGVVLIPILSLYIFIVVDISFVGRLKFASTYAIIPCVMFAGYVARNYAVSQTLLGSRAPSRMGFVENVERAATIVVTWFVPERVATPLVLLLLGMVLLGVVLWRFWRRSSHSRVLNHLVLLSGAFVVGYVSFIVVTSTITAYDNINDRLMSPIWPSLVLVVTFLFVGRQGGRQHQYFKATVTLLFVLWFFVMPFRHVMYKLNTDLSEGAGGYSLRSWRESELVAAIIRDDYAVDVALFSNAPDALYILADLEAQMSPAHREYNSEKGTGITAENLFEVYPELDGAYLIWSDLITHRHFLFSPEALGSMSSLVPIQQYSDGTIYRVSSAR